MSIGNATECPHCKTPFVPRHGNQKFCSPKCRERSEQKRYLRQPHIRARLNAKRSAKHRARRAAERAALGRCCLVCSKPLVYGKRGPMPKTCSDCRARLSHPPRPKTLSTCKGCGIQFLGRPDQQFHSGQCRQGYHSRKGPVRSADCATCGTPFPVGKRLRFCSTKCRLIAAYKRSNLSERTRERFKMRKKIAPTVNSIDPVEVFNRDNWTCQICHRKVKRNVRHRHPLSPSIDHILPIIDGGTHTMNNVQCAHFGCNSRKCRRRGAQQRLF